MNMMNPDTTLEKHLRVRDIARILGISRESARKLVKDEPGVVKIRLGGKKAMLSVPESVLRRIHARLSNR